MTKQRKLKLCFIGDISNVHCKKWVKFFVDCGHEVHFIDDHNYRYKNLKMHYLKNYTGIKLIDYLHRILRMRLIIRKINPDLVHSQQVTYHGFLGAVSGVHPFIVTPWGADILYDAERSAVYKKIIRFVFDKADIIHCIDSSITDRVSEIYADSEKKAFLLNEGVDTEIFKGGNANKNNNNVSIICLRTLSKHYNTLLFVEALNILVNKLGCKNIEATMCSTTNYGGDPDYKKMIDNLISRYNLSKYMKYFKWVNEVAYVKRFMENADIYVDTMARGKKGQGTGKTALEAMSSELAVVMPDNPGVKIYVKHLKNGIIYKKMDAKSLGKSLAILIKNKKLRLKIGKNGRKFILKNLDWNKNMKVMENKYYELVNNS